MESLMKLELRPGTRIELKSLFDFSRSDLEVKVRQMEALGWERHGPLRNHCESLDSRLEWIQTMVRVVEAHP